MAVLVCDCLNIADVVVRGRPRGPVGVCDLHRPAVPVVRIGVDGSRRGGLRGHPVLPIVGVARCGVNQRAVVGHHANFPPETVEVCSGHVPIFIGRREGVVLVVVKVELSGGDPAHRR